MSRLPALCLLALVACGSKPDDKKKEAPPPPPSTGSAAAPMPDAAAAAPAAAGLPAGRDAEAARLVKAGAACEVRDDSIPLDCKERDAAGDYAFEHQSSVEVAATCVELMRDPNTAVKLVASHCLSQVNARTATAVLGAALDVLEAEPNPTIKKQIGWGLKGGEAATAGLTDRALALFDELTADPMTEEASASVLDTLFPQYLMGDAPRPPPRAQQIVLDAFQKPGGYLFYRATDLIRLVEDKPAACKAVAGAIAAGGAEWWRAIGAFNDVGVACAEHAPAVLDVLLASYAAGKFDDPRGVARFAKLFELTPPLRKKAAAAMKAARKKAPEWQRAGIDEAAAEFARPWAAPTK